MSHLRNIYQQRIGIIKDSWFKIWWKAIRVWNGSWNSMSKVRESVVLPVQKVKLQTKSQCNQDLHLENPSQGALIQGALLSSQTLGPPSATNLPWALKWVAACLQFRLTLVRPQKSTAWKPPLLLAARDLAFSLTRTHHFQNKTSVICTLLISHPSSSRGKQQGSFPTTQT